MKEVLQKTLLCVGVLFFGMMGIVMLALLALALASPFILCFWLIVSAFS